MSLVGVDVVCVGVRVGVVAVGVAAVAARAGEGEEGGEDLGERGGEEGGVRETDERCVPMGVRLFSTAFILSAVALYVGVVSGVAGMERAACGVGG